MHCETGLPGNRKDLPMTLLIMGANGQLGFELCRQAPRRGYEVIPADRPDLDITRQEQVRAEVYDSGASMVVNAAAYTAVDDAEEDQETAFHVNRDGPAYLADACADRGIPLIHVSTDYVFYGLKTGPYFETDPARPLSVYGKSKAAGEDEIRQRLDRHIILRTAWLYGLHGGNFVKTMLRLGMEREEIRVVADQFGSPTSAAELASCIVEISNRIRTTQEIRGGTYHCCGKGRITWHGFAEEIFRIARSLADLKVERVTAVTTGEFPCKAPRPRNSVLDCSAVLRYFGFSTSRWQETLREHIPSMLQDAKNLAM